MKPVKEIIKLSFNEEDFTMDEFWAVIDRMPDDVAGRPHKKNIRAYFKKDGTPKAKALALSTDEDFQEMHHTLGFMRRYVRTQIHLNKLRKHKAAHKKHIKEVKEKKTEPKRITKYGKMESLEERRKNKTKPRRVSDDEE